MSAATVGSAALWGAVIFAALSLAPRLGKATTRRLLGVSALLATVATVILAVALIAGDFSLAYVAETTSRATPWPYRLSALWGGMDGSMLFYSAMTLAVGWFAAKRVDAGRLAMGVVAFVGVGWLLITATIANPFTVLDIPAVDGEGLLAILQHPAMIYHPPILYLGLTALVVPFALTVEAVATRQVDNAWITTTRRWLLVSWTFLTLGMVAGANWAYIELGWGGFWAWDPVENTALMPWLAATIFLHTSRIQERDGRLQRWNIFFALLPFALTVLGVYLTRSGVTGSIHAFAENPLIGRILLTAALVVGVGSLVLALRAAKGEPWERYGLARDTWLVSSGGLVAAALVFVTVGSAYPAYAQVFLDETVTVDTHFFVATILPIAFIVALAIGFALQTRWSTLAIPPRAVWLFTSAAAIVALMTVLLTDEATWPPIALLGFAAAATLLLGRDIIGQRPSGRTLAGHLAHLGLAVVLVGAAGSALGADFSGVMAPGDSVEVGGHTITLLDIETGEADRFIYAGATFELDGKHLVEAQIRGYEDQPLPVAEPALRSTPGSDVIVAISLLFPDASAVDVSVFVRPLVWWVWVGALMLALAGLVLLVSTGGAGAGQRQPATAARQRGETTSGTSAP